MLGTCCLNMEGLKLRVVPFAELFRLHKKSTSFYEQCQKNYRQNIVISKRMAPVTPDSKSAKRLDMTKTPKRMQQTKKPTPVSKTIPCLFEASKVK